MNTNPNSKVFESDPHIPSPDGLTKREYFAAMAMQGICANPTTEIKPYGKEIAIEAVLIADALTEQLNKPQ